MAEIEETKDGKLIVTCDCGITMKITHSKDKDDNDLLDIKSSFKKKDDIKDDNKDKNKKKGFWA